MASTAVNDIGGSVSSTAYDGRTCDVTRKPKKRKRPESGDMGRAKCPYSPFWHYRALGRLTVIISQLSRWSL